MMVSDTFTGRLTSFMRILSLLFLLPVLAGCLPSAGPRDWAYRPAAASCQHRLLRSSNSISRSPISWRRKGRKPRQHVWDGQRRRRRSRSGSGDMVAVSIFEAASGGLFSGETGTLGGGSKSVSLPEQPVSRNGTLSIPYVGQVRAAGPDAG